MRGIHPCKESAPARVASEGRLSDLDELTAKVAKWTIDLRDQRPVRAVADFFLGTFLPARRASDKPIAMACFRLLTLLPEPPLFNVPRLNSCIDLPTFLDAASLYFLAMTSHASGEDQDQQDNEKKAQSPARVVTPAGAVRPRGQCPQ